jgi:methionyl-tRNA synthetase
MQQYAAAMDGFDLRAGAEAISALVTAADHYVVATAPWSLAKAGCDAELDRALASLARTLYRLALLASPFLPEKSSLLWSALGQSGAAPEQCWELLAAPELSGAKTSRPPVLFPKPEAPR